MKKKVGTLLDEEVIRRAQRRAAEKRNSLNDMVPEPKKREKAYRLFCERPICISKDQFKQVLEELS